MNGYKSLVSVGDCVSVNLLVSSSTVFISQMSGFITCKLYHYKCVFLYHDYDFTYAHLLKSQTGYEAVEAKEAFESYVESHGVDIKN